MTGSLLIGEFEQETIVSFKNVGDFETYVNATDNSGHDGDDVTFRLWLYKKIHLNLKK